MNITIDDTSPQITFHSASNGWITAHTDDPLTGEYFGGTFHSTTTDGDYMNIKFVGSAIYVFGAYRENHGLYSTQLDNGNVGYNLGFSQHAQIQHPLYVAGGLDLNREHSLTITNLPSQTNPPGNATLKWYLDIDYIVITVPQTKKIYTTIYDDLSPAIEYTGFTSHINYSFGYYNQTNHLSGTGSSTARLSFNGTSIQVFAGINDDHGNYSVNLDGGAAQVFNGTSDKLYVNTSLFLATNLTEGRHDIQLTNLGSGKLVALDLDFIVVNSTVAPILGRNATNTTTGSSDPVQSSSKTSSKVGHASESSGGGSSLSGGAVGGIVGGVVALGLIAFLSWLFFLRKKRRMGKGDAYSAVDLNGSPHHAPMALDGGEVAPFPPSSSGYGPSGSTAPGSVNEMSQVHKSTGAFFTMIPPPPPSDATSYPRSVAAPSEAGNRPSAYTALAPSHPGMFGQHEAFSLPQVSGAAAVTPPVTTNTPTTPSTTFAFPQSAAQSMTPAKSPGAATLPFTATPSNDSFRVHAGGRINVPGREVDLGPVPMILTSGGLLPPDYHQATQPLPGQAPSS